MKASSQFWEGLVKDLAVGRQKRHPLPNTRGCFTCLSLSFRVVLRVFLELQKCLLDLFSSYIYVRYS